MSLQRVFESARKLGLPVILTDPAGREPMVVLPLEQFEALAGEGHASESLVSSTPVAPETRQPIYAPMQTSAHAPHIKPTVHLPKIEEIQPNPVVGLSPEVQESFEAVAMEKPESPLEERFYLESLEDQSEG